MIAFCIYALKLLKFPIRIAQILKFCAKVYNYLHISKKNVQYFSRLEKKNNIGDESDSYYSYLIDLAGWI